MISQFYQLLANRKEMEREARVNQKDKEILSDYTKENTFKPVINKRQVTSRSKMSHDRYSNVLS